MTLKKNNYIDSKDLRRGKSNDDDLNHPKDLDITFPNSKKTQPTLYFFPGLRVVTSDSLYFYNLNKEARINSTIKLSPKIASIRQYLKKNLGVFSSDYYTTLLSPKVSTRKTVAGVSRDKKRSMLVKLLNLNFNGGLKLNSMKIFNSALTDFYMLLKADKSSEYFISTSRTYKELLFLNTSYKDSVIPLTQQLTYLTNNTTPKFVIKKHINKLPGRKKKKKGPLSLRSYLAFIKPSGRRLSSLKWLASSIKRMDTNRKLKVRIMDFFINSVMTISDKTPIVKKVEIYQGVLSYLKRKN